MEMKNYIEKAEKKAGKQVELAKILGISDAYIRMVKSGKRGFPDDICIQIADYIGDDRLEVIAASNLVTEKDEKKRKIFESCFSRAASIIITTSVISILTLSIQKPVNAQKISSNLPCYTLLAIERRKKPRRKSNRLTDLFYKFLNAFQRTGSLSY